MVWTGLRTRDDDGAGRRQHEASHQTRRAAGSSLDAGRRSRSSASTRRRRDRLTAQGEPRAARRRNPATKPQARRRAPIDRSRRKKIGVPTDAKIKNQWALPKADMATIR